MFDVALKHQLRIARQTLRMSDVGARIMGGMTKREACEVLRMKGSAEDRKLVEVEIGEILKKSYR